MTSESPELAAIRQQIDEIDQALHDGLSRRLGLVSEVAKAKAGEGAANGSAMRPGREAEIIRRLADQKAPQPPLAVSARIWREVVNSATRMQGPLTIAVCAPDKSVGYWDLARNHFGSATPMTLHRSSMVVLRQVLEERGTIGIMPLPQEGEDEPWWVSLSSAGEAVVPKIIWRLPFYSPDPGVFEELEAFVIGPVVPEDTGDDVTIVVVETDREASRGRILEMINAPEAESRIIAVQEDEATDLRLLMLEVAGFRDEEDPIFDSLRQSLGESLRRILILGTYPRPIKTGHGA